MIDVMKHQANFETQFHLTTITNGGCEMQKLKKQSIDPSHFKRTLHIIVHSTV